MDGGCALPSPRFPRAPRRPRLRRHPARRLRRPGDTGPAAAPQWVNGADLLAPLQENAVVTLGGELWVVGGFGDTGGSTDRVEAWDPDTDGWRTVTGTPRPVHHADAWTELAPMPGDLARGAGAAVRRCWAARSGCPAGLPSRASGRWPHSRDWRSPEPRRVCTDRSPEARAPGSVSPGSPPGTVPR